jgi:hypothetical protein
LRVKKVSLPVVSDDTSLFPPLHARWVDELLGASIPPESEATCASCVMLPSPDEDDGGVHFDPRIKCCTYHPVLHNFLVGAALQDAGGEGLARLEARLDSRLGVSPLGVLPPPGYQQLYRSSVDLFGRTMTLRCPLYLEEQGGACGVWMHRESTCSTWFCKHSRGASGQRFWRALRELLVAAERALSKWCVLELDLDDRALEALFPIGDVDARAAPSPNEIDGCVDEERYRAVWGGWLGRERAWFQRSAELVAPLRWADIVRIAGPELKVMERRVRATLAPAIGAEPLPARLRVGSLQIVAAEPDGMQIATYSAYDAVRMSTALFQALSKFDGRPVAEARAAIAEEYRLALDDEFVRHLVDFRILIPTAT